MNMLDRITARVFSIFNLLFSAALYLALVQGRIVNDSRDALLSYICGYFACAYVVSFIKVNLE